MSFGNPTPSPGSHTFCSCKLVQISDDATRRFDPFGCQFGSCAEQLHDSVLFSLHENINMRTEVGGGGLETDVSVSAVHP